MKQVLVMILGFGVFVIPAMGEGQTVDNLAPDISMESGLADSNAVSANSLPPVEILTTPLADSETDCVKPSAYFYNDWILWGKPACWCYARQCRGDTDGKSVLDKPVTLVDLDLFKKFAFNQTDAALMTIPDGICADLDHKAALNKRVTLADLKEFKKYFNQPLANVPECDMTNYNFWVNP
jgi:hypothetical protein